MIPPESRSARKESEEDARLRLEAGNLIRSDAAINSRRVPHGGPCAEGWLKDGLDCSADPHLGCSREHGC